MLRKLTGGYDLARHLCERAADKIGGDAVGTAENFPAHNHHRGEGLLVR